MDRNKNKIFKFFVLTMCSLSWHSIVAQTYPPAASVVSTTAMYKDSSAFVNWALACELTRGYQDISTPSLGLASSGTAAQACGHADVGGVVSLGDAGSAICTFQYPITNGPGFDFAVFENSFDDSFLELAFVEVSSDGINFFRFHSHSLSDTVIQTGTFGSTDPTKLNNLAGKYRGGYGTPFDLQDLIGISILNIDAITHVKIIDVVGSIHKAYASYDSHFNKINEPWPTPFASGGFDLDAVGVIHQKTITGISPNALQREHLIYPSSVKQGEKIYIRATNLHEVSLMDLSGRCVLLTDSNILETEGIEKGMYLLLINYNGLWQNEKIQIW